MAKRVQDVEVGVKNEVKEESSPDQAHSETTLSGDGRMLGDA